MIIARSANIVSAGHSTLYTASKGGTLQIRALNAGTSSAVVELSLTATPESPAVADKIDIATLEPRQSLLVSGEPIATGESVVITPSGSNINLSCRVSGFMEDA